MTEENNYCSCLICKEMCSRPCWGTPNEIKKLIDAGYGKRLMRDYWVGGFNNDGYDLYIISPALKGYETYYAPEFPRGKCTFFNDAGLCELHDKGLKPKEGRITSCKNQDIAQDIHEAIAKTWNTQEGKMVVELWEELDGDEYAY